MKKMYLAIFLIILVAFVFAGCLSFSGTLSTSPTEPDDELTFIENNTTSIAVNPNPAESTTAAVIPEGTTAQGQAGTAEATTAAQGSTETTTAPSTGNVIPNPAPASSDYDILKSGNFYFIGSMTDKTGESAPMEIAITPDSVYMISDFGGVPMGMLIKGEKLYMVYPDKKAYLELSDSIMSMAGLDIDELTSADSINFSSYGNLSDAASVTEEAVNGRTCQVYHFNVDSGESRVYMDGSKLVRLASYDKTGKFLTSTDITSLSSNVPADKCNPPSSYKAYKGVTGMFSFMTLLDGVIE